MSKEFEEIILQKLNSIENKLTNVDNRIIKVEEELNELDNRIIKVEEKLNELDNRITKVKDKLIKIDTRLTNVEEGLNIARYSLVKLEDKVNRELPALFEVYQINYDLQKENVQRTNILETKSENFSIKIDNLEETVNKHSNELKKLIS